MPVLARLHAIQATFGDRARPGRTRIVAWAVALAASLVIWGLAVQVLAN